MGFRRFSIAAFCLAAARVVSAEPSISVLHPLEGAKLPAIQQTFVMGSASTGTMVSINGSTISVHEKGGFLVMVPLKPGDVVLNVSAIDAKGEIATVQRRFAVAAPFTPASPEPTTINDSSLEPKEDLWLTYGDSFRVAFVGSSQGQAELALDGRDPKLPMTEVGTVVKNSTTPVTTSGKGIYETSYTVSPLDEPGDHRLTVHLRGPDGKHKKEKLKAKLKIDDGRSTRIGIIKDDVTAVRIAPDGGYDFFLYKGMKVKLIGKIGKEWRVRLASDQIGWVKESSLDELPASTVVPRSILGNLTLDHNASSTLIKIPLTEMLPFRVEQSLDPMQLTVTVYGAINRTDLIRYDSTDALVNLVRWKQTSPDTCQIIVTPRFKKWWGADVRYEGNTLIIEVRKPWTQKDVKGMTIALDPGHGGTDSGALGPHGFYEKDANLKSAFAVRQILQEAGASVYMTREDDRELPLNERQRMAFKNGAQLFISLHCNSSPPGGNPIDNNGYSVYWHQPQSLALAQAIHKEFGQRTKLDDIGLFFADFAVCRPPMMPAVLIEQAFIIVPEQEAALFDPAFHKKVGQAILTGIRNFLKP